MTGKRLCTIDSCEYCPYFEKTHIASSNKKSLKRMHIYYKCNKTLLCVEYRGLKNPLGLLFKYCPLPNVENNDSELKGDFK